MMGSEPRTNAYDDMQRRLQQVESGATPIYLSGGPNERGVWPNEWLARELYDAHASAMFLQEVINLSLKPSWEDLGKLEQDRWSYIASKALQRIQRSQREWWLRDWAV